MKLYHFTAFAHARSILSEGLTRGEIPVSATDYQRNGVWLTDDPNQDSQRWAINVVYKTPSGEVRMMPASRAPLEWRKRGVLFEVEIDEGDTRLRHWPALAQELGVTKKWYLHLDDTGAVLPSTGMSTWV